MNTARCVQTRLRRRDSLAPTPDAGCPVPHTSAERLPADPEGTYPEI
ncbi:hypothetical protein [Kamptonema formosum]|nr:hypothetical protein [Oscillatoria sp. PCC 10802]